MATVTELIAAREAAAEALATEADAYLQQLVDLANVEFSNDFNVDNLLPDSYDYASVPAVNFGVLGATRPAITASTAVVPEAPLFSFSSIADIDLPTDDLLAPTSTFEFYEAVYASTLLDPLKAKLLADLTNGGYGIEPADEIALFNRERDREIEAMMSRVTDAGRFHASRGFPLPPGELGVMVDSAYQDMQNKVSSVSRDITLARTKLYVENRQFTIREIRELEQVLIGFHNSVQERAMNVARLSVEMGIRVYMALIDRYRIRLEGAKITSEVERARAQTEAEIARARVEAFRGQVIAYEANLRGLLESSRLTLDVYRADIDAVRSANEASLGRVALQQKVIEATTQQNIQISNLAIETARVKLLATVEALKFKTGAAHFGSEKFFALLTSIEGSINSLAVQSATE